MKFTLNTNLQEIDLIWSQRTGTCVFCQFFLFNFLLKLEKWIRGLVGLFSVRVEVWGVKLG